MNNVPISLKVLGGVAVGALILSGCAGTATPETEQTLVEQTLVEQTLVAVPDIFPPSLDITTYPAEEGVQLAAHQVLETLTVSRDGEFVPGLAASWENPDANTWVFNLREGVKFSDGTAFTSSDVAATIARHIEIKSVLSSLLSTIVEVDDSDPTKVVITTEPALGNLLGTLSMLYLGKGDSINDTDYWQLPVGTGPFKIDSYSPDEYVKMSRNELYWGTPALPDTLELRNIPEEGAKVTALETGEVDVLINISPDQIGSARSTDGINLDTSESLTYYLGWYNHGREPFNDPSVRQALWHAVDYATVVPALFGESATLGRAPLAASAFGAPELEPYKYDPELAKELLAEAGYPNGFETTLSWPNDGGPNVKQLAQAMISAFAEIGVTVTSDELPRANWVENLLAFKWDMQIFTNTTASGDADYTIGRLYTSKADRLGFASDEVDAWLAEASSSVDQARRAELFGLTSKYLWDNAVGFFPAQLVGNIAYADDIQGLELPPNKRIDFALVSRG